MSFRLILCAAAMLASALSVTIADKAIAATQLVPHRAIYSVSLSPDSGGSPVIDVDGVMSMSLEKTCDGWIFTQDMKSVITIEDGNTVQLSALFTSWESLDGGSYRFASRIQTGMGQLILRGDARMNADGTGVAVYREPEQTEVSLPKDTLFPVSHTIWLIDEAKAGTRSAPRIVFTGSEDLEAELVNAFIGDRITADHPAAKEFGALAEGDGWPLIMAFYPIASQTGVPTFEMRALQLENGVSPELVMNFGDFATRLMIQSLEPIELPSCS